MAEWRDESGVTTLAIDQDERRYRFEVHGAGVYDLARDGSHVTCVPAPDGDWTFTRYLIGQVLPFAALLQGLEVFHASAVELDGSVVALAGGTGVGKSTLALNLHLGGAGYVTDDVVAVELRDGQVLVHRGLSVVKVRRAASDLVDSARLGSPAVSDTHELRYLIDAVETPLPLGTFCVLERSDDRSIRIEEAGDSPWQLLASTFNLLVDTPERLAAQLDVCAAISRSARVLNVHVPDRPDAAVAAQLSTALARAAAAA